LIKNKFCNDRSSSSFATIPVFCAAMPRPVIHCQENISSLCKYPFPTATNRMSC
jgi:hypothetical protein